MRDFTGFKRGINLGGWLSQCLDHYNEEHYSSFIVEDDIKEIAGWGLDHVRLPIDYNVIQNEDGSFIESGFLHVDDAVKWSEKYGLNIILDIHKAKGYVFDDENYCSFFTDESEQNDFIALWKEIARRYGGRDNIVFELLNEVTSEEFAKPWNAIAARTIPEIRAIAPTTRIIIGGIFNNSIYGLSLLDAPYDENIVFTFHCYSPLVFTHQKAGWVPKLPSDFACKFPIPLKEMRDYSFKYFDTEYEEEFEGLDEGLMDDSYFKKMFGSAIATAEKYNVPLYCGEYGVIDQADPESTVAWYEMIHKAMEECNISRAAWTYKKMDFGITQECVASVKDKLIALL